MSEPIDVVLRGMAVGETRVFPAPVAPVDIKKDGPDEFRVCGGFSPLSLANAARELTALGVELPESRPLSLPEAVKKLFANNEGEKQGDSW